MTPPPPRLLEPSASIHTRHSRKLGAECVFDGGAYPPRPNLRRMPLRSPRVMGLVGHKYALYPYLPISYPQLSGSERTAYRQLNAQATGRLSVRQRTGYPQLIDGRTHKMSAGCRRGRAQATDSLPTFMHTGYRQVGDNESTAWTHTFSTSYPQVF